MKKAIVFFLLIQVLTTNAQNSIEWDGIYQLQLSDFQSEATQIGSEVSVTSINTASSLDFAFMMNNVEFMFTKNFNSKVNCSFQRDAAYLVAPDTNTANKLLDFARYEFDLSELYARKLRKEIYEQKGTFSDVSFLKVIYDHIQKQYTEEHATAAKSTNLGLETAKLAVLHTEVTKQIQNYPDFCKSCKPPKKKK
ncbi:hypothetical protein SAMN05443667_101607 [Flavobacterium gillisiae]|uniref:DUF4468 domain-containing protein n=1 Tax=Flavobacterium gillisiae TaxID=150146 RepID=A0A1H3XPA0_9FLAO|nr:hypothetical protein [Flavobacterium gillisiae]SEA01257.1 hypothetical protein SAMN05443667_101607 [Flavobacterium gillisiae]